MNGKKKGVGRAWTGATMALFLGASLAIPSGLAFAGAKGGNAIEISVTEKGYEPSPIKVEKGKPVTLVVTRKTDKTCAKEIVIDEFEIKKELPLNKPVKLTFTPKKSGTLKYGCAMGKMIAGVLTVE